MFLKGIPVIGAIALCSLSFFPSNGQVKLPFKQSGPVKTEIFRALPDTILALTSGIERLFLSPVSGRLKIPAGLDQYFEGTLIEKVQKSPWVTSINIRSSNFDDALITISRITEKGKPVEYIGRIVNNKYSDMYILKKQDDQYFFAKLKQSLLLVE